jgi:hypothetical protein
MILLFALLAHIHFVPPVSPDDTASFTFSQNAPLIDCDQIPPLNQKVVEFVNGKIKKKVGKGECWDLAAEALNIHGAKWDKKYHFGKKVDYRTECIYPGDIMQFENVVIETVTKNSRFRETMPHHTAVIYEVAAKGQYMLAHQNYNNVKKVTLVPLSMENIKKGRVSIFRPTY